VNTAPTTFLQPRGTAFPPRPVCAKVAPVDRLVMAALSARRTLACVGAALLFYAIAFPMLVCPG
jgi:hypothetical protein